MTTPRWIGSASKSGKATWPSSKRRVKATCRPPSPDSHGTTCDASPRDEPRSRVMTENSSGAEFVIFRELRVRTVFVGMFDEVDEGTAIYKVAGRLRSASIS